MRMVRPKTVFVLLAAATGMAITPVAAAAAVAPKILPAFSWATLPVAFHSSNSSGGWTDLQINELARYAMVTLEKFQDIAAVAPASTLAVPYGSAGGLYRCTNHSDLSRCGCCAEDAIVAAARAIKAVNPAVVTVAYLNAQISYGWYRAAREMAAHPDWWLKDAKHAGPPGSTWPIYDLTVPAAATSWQQACLNLTGTGVIDSCFADGCVTRESGPRLSPARAARLLQAKHAMLRRLQTQVPGPIVCGSNGEFLNGVGAVQAEGWGVSRNGHTHFATVEIPTLMAAARAGVVFQAHGRAACGQSQQLPPGCLNPPCPHNVTSAAPSHTDPAVQTELAAFMVAMGVGSYYLCGSWEDTLAAGGSSWLPVYDLPLGAPLGNATLSAAGIWHRRFASGTTASFDTKTETGTIVWATPPDV